MGTKWEWDDSQRKVVECAPEERILVDAGPGTGKTAVACGRVAWLVNNCGMNPDNIWLISFTRTAVQEIRDRIKSFLNDEGSAYAIKIATLDSHAWKIHSGFDNGAAILGTYDENITKLTELVKKDKQGDVSNYFQTVQHLIVDETQDIVGIRAELILEIMKKLSDNCGVTIFSDEAQAIYGFSLDGDSRYLSESQKTLTEMVRNEFRDGFSPCELRKVFRTKSHTLNELFTVTRQKVMKPSKEPSQKLQNIREEISQLADNRKLPKIKKETSYPDDSFILFRKRAEVLMASSFLGTTPHRIRMSGLPQCIHPWIGVCLSEHTKKSLTKKDFLDCWKTKLESTSLKKTVDKEDAWEQLVRLAGKTATLVDMNLLRIRLGQAKPPAEFCTGEIGTRGPIIGTIHASKGREADNIYLMMPEEVNCNTKGDESTDYEEETRVMFVGATRARKYLGVGKGYKRHFPSKVEPSGRVFANKGNVNAMIEIGRDTDINAMGLAGQKYYKTSDIVRKNQKKLCCLGDNISMASALIDRDCDYVYRVTPENENEDIVVLSKQALTNDLFEIGKRIGGGNNRPPDKLKFLRIYGIRTIVLPPDSPECNTLHEPWSRSGILLAPVILGYTKEYFPYYRR